MDPIYPIPFDNSYARLPERFFAAQNPVPVAAPALICANESLASSLGINPDWLKSEEGIATIAGNHIPKGATPISAAYAGHQFGSWNPQLGDGRAVLLGEVIASDGQRYDIQLKGSGPTPWSRGGDGRSPLGPVLREYLLSEAMAVLGVPTSRALAAVTTGDTVYRESALPGAVLARVASSHIRIGTVQYFAARQDEEAIETLVGHVLARHYPDRADEECPALALLEEVIKAQAELVAKWQLLGFIHGVMNTDNMLLSGETIDYGPCAFMDTFNPDTVFSSIDHGGRYAYRNQPAIAHWNLSCLAQCLLPLIDSEEDAAVTKAQTAIDTFPQLFLDAHTRGMNKKLGLSDQQAGDEELVEELLAVMASSEQDFTLCFRGLTQLAQEGDITSGAPWVLADAFDPWLEKWQSRLQQDPLTAADRGAMMSSVNPVFIPRNHQVEAAIRAAEDDSDFAPFAQLNAVLQSPFEYRSEWNDYALPAKPEQRVYQTFCGT